MKKLKKVIAGVAAVAALVAVPTATAMAESTEAVPDTITWNSYTINLSGENDPIPVCDLNTVISNQTSEVDNPGYYVAATGQGNTSSWNQTLTVYNADGDELQTVTVNFYQDDSQCTAATSELTTFAVNYYDVDIEAAASSDGYTIEVDSLDGIDGQASSSVVTNGGVLSGPSCSTSPSNLKKTCTYTLYSSDGTEVQTYTVIFVVKPSVTSFVIDHDYLVYGENLEAAATSNGYTFYVDSLDGITGEVTDIAAKGSLSSPSCSTNSNNTKMTCTYSLYRSDGNRTDQLYTINFVVSDEETEAAEPSVTSFEINYKYLLQDADLAEAATSDGYTFEVESLDGIDGTVTGSAISNKGKLSGPACSTDADGTQMTCTYSLYRNDGTRTDQLFTVHFVVVADGDTSEGDSGEGDNTGDDTTGDDENTGDDTTDGDDTVDEDDTTDGTENPSDDESDTDDTDDTEATSDEESESDGTSTLATTGSALLGIGVFALVALIGAGVVYTVRKRA